jgi:hypothetical protein
MTELSKVQAEVLKERQQRAPKPAAAGPELKRYTSVGHRRKHPYRDIFFETLYPTEPIVSDNWIDCQVAAGVLIAE